jgi:two-component system, response regulator PdtaR
MATEPLNDELAGDPTSRNAPAPAPDKTPLDATSLIGRSILVVEDSWHAAQALKAVLDKAGMDVSGPVATVTTARASVAKKRPAMALVDVNLGGEMAYGLIDELLGQDIAVVVVSGYELLPSLEPKVAAILTKPIRAAVLLATLRRIASMPTAH